MTVDGDCDEHSKSVFLGDENLLKKFVRHKWISLIIAVSIVEIIFGILLFINVFDIAGVISIIISVALGIVQIWFALQIYTLQENAANIREILGTEIEAYSRLTSPVSDCYVAAVGLHPIIGLGGMPSGREECRVWHESRRDLVLSKIRAVEVVTDANSPFIPEEIVSRLKEFSDLCFDLCSAYDEAYIVSNNTDPAWRDYMIENQKKCPELTKEIKKKYDEYQKCLTERIEQLHKKP